MKVQYAGRCLDEMDKQYMMEAVNDGVLTAGRFTKQFEKEFAQFVGKKYITLTNSGSSANLLALSALMDPSIPGHLVPGDEVITIAAGFPTTVNPIIQLGLVPVFVDIEMGTYNANMDQIDKMICTRPNKIKCIFIPHTLGNPYDIEWLTRIQENNPDLFIIADCCDALGSEYKGKHIAHGIMQTYSFYPAHHITGGEAGCVTTDSPHLAEILRSMAAWGRTCTPYCSCSSSEDEVCKSRFNKQYGDLPLGYDRKYVYTHIGYNFQITEMQAALLCSQLEKIYLFVSARRINFRRLFSIFEKYEDYFVLPLIADRNHGPSWFSFPLTVRQTAPFTRNELTAYFAEKGIETRNLFAGNILKQPAYKHIKYRRTDLSITDIVMENTFFLGVYPGITDEMIEYIKKTFEAFMGERI